MSNTNMQVAETILSQLGGAGRLRAMCGCKDFGAGDQSLQFKVGSNAKKVTACVVTLEPSDTYRVTFFTGRGVNMREARRIEDVYADSLVAVFESETGMYLSL